MENQDHEKNKQEEKELKRLLDAHVLVLKNKLGRTPSMEEIQESLGKGDEASSAHIAVASEKPQPGEPKQQVKAPAEQPNTAQPLTKTETDPEGNPEIVSEPRILNTRVYYGMGEAEDGSKKPDPHKILFYEAPDNRCYCTEKQEWLNERPSVLDHLPSRDIQFSERDIVNAIAHGVMDDSDYSALEKAGMVTETPKKLWDLTKKLKTQMEELEKSQEEPESEEEVSSDDAPEGADPKVAPMDVEEDEDNMVDTDYLPEGHSESSGEDMLKYFLDTAGVQGSAQEDLIDVVGEDALSKIMQAATTLALTGLEEQIRAIVREELGNSNDSEELEYEVENGDEDSEI